MCIHVQIESKETDNVDGCVHACACSRVSACVVDRWKIKPEAWENSGDIKAYLAKGSS